MATKHKMKSQKLVSVVMGVYNPKPKYLQSAVHSILNQTYKNLEFIICDDGSIINKKCIYDLPKWDERIKIITNDKNMGLAYSLNKCIEISKGEYIARQDADDISEWNRIEKQVIFLETDRKIDFVGCNIKYFDEKIWGVYRLKDNPKKKDFLLRVPFMHGTMLYRKKIFDAGNWYTVSKITRRCEDYYFFMDLYSKGYKGSNIQDYLYIVREDKQAVSRRKFKYRIDEVFVRFIGFNKMKLNPVYYLFIFKPVIIGIIPKTTLSCIKDKIYGRKIK